MGNVDNNGFETLKLQGGLQGSAETSFRGRPGMSLKRKDFCYVLGGACSALVESAASWEFQRDSQVLENSERSISEGERAVYVKRAAKSME